MSNEERELLDDRIDHRLDILENDVRELYDAKERIDAVISEINESLMKRYKYLLEEEDKFRDGE